MHEPTAESRALAERAGEIDRRKFLQIAEHYASLQGEGAHAGWPCYFIRTAVCDLRCSWCDTPEALGGGEWIDLNSLLVAIPDHVHLVQITGGEPLLQKPKIALLAEILAEAPYRKQVLLETGGHRLLEGLPGSLHIVMDVKLPGSGEATHEFAANFPFLKPTDEIKFVVADRADFDRAVHWIREHDLTSVCQILFSPVWGRAALRELAEWILESRLPVRLQTQLHKHIWGGEARGV